jgi:hypothetical protein
MRKTTPLALAATLFATMSCAPAPDVDALAAHLRQCGLGAPTPSCAFDTTNPDAEAASQAAVAFVIEKHAESVEACILAVDCSDERMASDASDEAQDEVNACFPDAQAETRSETCLNDCLSEMYDCTGTTTMLSSIGLDAFCDAADVTWCLEAHERCNESC